jgi:hypothetical protein
VEKRRANKKATNEPEEFLPASLDYYTPPPATGGGRRSRPFAAPAASQPASQPTVEEEDQRRAGAPRRFAPLGLLLGPRLLRARARRLKLNIIIIILVGVVVNINIVRRAHHFRLREQAKPTPAAERAKPFRCVAATIAFESVAAAALAQRAGGSRAPAWPRSALRASHSGCLLRPNGCRFI